VATDNGNATATNSVSITVTNVPAASITIRTPTFNGSAFGFDFLTQTGRTYQAQFTLGLESPGWSTFSNVIGDGSLKHVTDSNATNSHRYYRVVIP
jgi:hypothetical protein